MKKKRNILITVTALGILGLLWFREDSLAPSFAPISSQNIPLLKEHQKVELNCKVYSPEDSKLYLKRNLIDKGLQPIQITIFNNTPNTYIVSAKELNLTTVHAKDAAWKVTHTAIPRAIGYKVASLIFWPFMLPGTIDSIKTFRTHQMLRKDFAAKEFKEEEIAPYSTVNRIVFTPVAEAIDPIQVTLVDKKSQEKLLLQPASDSSSP